MSTPDTQIVETLPDPEAGAEWRELPRSFGIRRRLKLTVEQFAERYCFPAEMVRAWEAGSAVPDAMADAHLRVIAARPDETAALVCGRTKAAAE